MLVGRTTSLYTRMMKRYFFIAIGVALLTIFVGMVGILIRYASLGDPTPPAPPTPRPIATTTESDLWKTSIEKETGITFSYPERLLSEFITAQSWPPKIRIATGTLVCVEKVEDRGESTRQRTIDGRSYCVTEQNEGAAGSTYTIYTYQTQKDGKVISADLTLRAVQCANYDEPRRTTCGEEREVFDLDQLMGRIIESATFR